MIESIEITSAPGERIGEICSPSFVLPPPTIINRDVIPERYLAAMSKTWERGRFEGGNITVDRLFNVFVTNQGLVFTEDKRVVTETITQHTSAEQAAALTKISDMRALEINSPSLLMRKRGDQNYGHWLVEVLPKLGFAKRLCDVNSLVIPKVGGMMQSVIIDSLSLFDSEPIALFPHQHEQVFFMRELIIVSGATRHGTYMSPLVVNELDNLKSNIDIQNEKKIFVSRKGADRDISNVTEVEEFLSILGFNIVHPGEMSLQQQIDTFSAASCVVGVMGAGMTNIVFAKRGAKVINIAPMSMPDTFFYLLSVHKQQIYTEIRCESVEGRDNRNGKIHLNLSELSNAIIA